MAYTAPLGNIVNFDLTPGYVQPDGDAVDFSLGGAETIIVRSPGFFLSSELEVSTILWSVSLDEFDVASYFESPIIQIQVILAQFEAVASLGGNPVPRVKFPEFNFYSNLIVEFINEIGEGITPIAPRPFELQSELEKPLIVHVISGAEFNLSSSIDENLLILVDGVGSVSFPALEVESEISADLMPAIWLSEFALNSSIEILAIVSMPDGDQYTVCPPFSLASEIDNSFGVIVGVPLEEFVLESSLEIEDIYIGVAIESQEFDLNSTLESSVHPALLLTNFNLNSSLSADVQIQVFCDDFDLASEIELTIYDGESVSAEPFNLNSKLGASIFIGVSVPSFDLNSTLEISTISSFIDAQGFNLESEISLGNIRIFTFEDATIYYYCVLTGAEDGLGDLEIEFNSLQTRLRSGNQTYLSVTTVGMEQAEDISDRPNGKLQIYMGYKIDSETTVQKLIVETNFDSIDLYQGPMSESAVLTGYKTETFVQKSIELENPIYKAFVNGVKRYRFAVPNLNLNPGDSVEIDGDTFDVDTISIYIKNAEDAPYSTMEIASI